jgi:transcriptional regulator with XRE-family HTH domain
MPYKVLTVEGLIALMKDVQGGKKQQEFASDLGVSPQYLSDVYNQRRDPGPKILKSFSASTAYLIPEETVNVEKSSGQVEKREEESSARKLHSRQVRVHGKRKG